MTGDSIIESYELAGQLLKSRTSFVQVTLVAVRGSAPQVVGAKAIITAAGLQAGTVGGGKVEAAAIELANKMLADASSQPTLEVWNLQTDIGMTCGGEVKLFFDPHVVEAWPIAVFGAGHVSQALVRFLVELECQVTVVDARPEWLDRLPASSKLTTVCLEDPKEMVPQLPGNTYFVLMSKGHATDLPVLHAVLSSRTPPYIGVIGSKQKASVLRRDLTRLGLSEEAISQFHCPMGLPIGNNTPPEIAISILAQLLSVRDGQNNQTVGKSID